MISSPTRTPSCASQRQVIGFFGALALLLGAIGIYGVMAHSVGQQTHEIGIRMALGASNGEVMRLVLGQGLKVTLVGIVFGPIAAAGVTRALSSMLYKVKASDPGTFAFVVVFSRLWRLLRATFRHGERCA